MLSDEKKAFLHSCVYLKMNNNGQIRSNKRIDSKCEINWESLQK